MGPNLEMSMNKSENQFLKELPRRRCASIAGLEILGLQNG